MDSVLSLRRRILAGDITVDQASTAQYAIVRADSARQWGCLTHVFEQQDSVDHRLPLAGVGLAHKDIFAMRGRLPLCGTPQAQALERRGSPVIAALERAGAMTLAALALAEFAAGVTGENPHLARPVNPIDPRAAVGGSSSGSAVGVAAGLCYGSVGTDTAGSVRIPAASCGIVGLKPTHGALSTSGCFPLAPTLDTVGVLARSTLDAAYIYACSLTDHRREKALPRYDIPRSIKDIDAWPAHIAQQMPARERIAFAFEHAYPLFDPAPTQRKVLLDFAHTYAAHALPTLPGLQTLIRSASTVLHTESAVVHARALCGAAPGLTPITRAVALPGAAIPAAWYRAALANQEQLRANFLENVLHDHDILLTPVLPHGVPDWDMVCTNSPHYRSSALSALFSWTSFVNYLGLPAIVFPIGKDEKGRPISIQAIGRPWADATLIAFACNARCADLHAPNNGMPVTGANSPNLFTV
ncbi:amidase [Pusillimonas sp. TS35]|uniref:amidase family protein n=1 Tax=Paracandidimonas lactea TaxID=2895524 RepID=UPI00136D395E|nr:amidase [Paracandidimonas lactea]MYN13891.1 amidase [Pusillimonas sp. TS35]